MGIPYDTITVNNYGIELFELYDIHLAYSTFFSEGKRLLNNEPQGQRELFGQHDSGSSVIEMAICKTG